MDDYSFIDIAGTTGVERQNLIDTLRNVNLAYFDSDLLNRIPIDQQPDAQVEENPPQAGLNHGQNGHYPQMEENLAQGGPTAKQNGAKQNGAMNGPQEASLNCEDGPSENPLLSRRKRPLNPSAKVFEPRGIQQCQNMAQTPQAANTWSSNPNGSGVSYADRVVNGVNGNDPRAWKTSWAGPSHQHGQQMKTANGYNGYNGHNGQIDSAAAPPSEKEKDDMKLAVYNFLCKHQVDSRVTFEARGIINKAVYCFINAALQALFAVNRFAALLSGLAKATESYDLERIAPLCGALLHMWRDYTNKSTMGPLKDNHILKHLDLLRNDNINTVSHGDAAEFILCFLMKLQEELRFIKFDEETADRMNRGAENGQGEEEGWQVKVGRRSGRRQMLVDDTCLLTTIFGGAIVYLPKKQPSEPIFTLDLAIIGDDIKTLQDAIRQYFAEEVLDTKKRQKVAICQLPDTLILTMKINESTNGRIKKMTKQISITECLHLESDWVTDEIQESMKKCRLAYRLTAAIFHSGASFDKGHFWCYTRRNNKQWNLLDDGNATCVGVEKVLNYHNRGEKTVPQCLVFQLHKEM